jgi:hypothetical protein
MAGPKPREEYPAPGSTYAVPLPNGEFGACRVIRQELLGPDLMSVVVALDGFWKAPPTLEGLAGRPLLAQVRSGFGGSILKGYVSGNPPSAFRRLGALALSEEEREVSLPLIMFRNWRDLAEHIYLEWRWVYDRQAFVADVEARHAAFEDQLEERERRRERRLSTLTLEKMRREKPFRHWLRMWPREVVEDARGAFNRATDALMALGPAPDLDACRRALENLIEEFNELDAKHGGWIETEERVDILERFKELAHLVGLSDDVETLAGVRDW